MNTLRKIFLLDLIVAILIASNFADALKKSKSKKKKCKKKAFK